MPPTTVAPDPLRLPEGTRLVHIGPPKTGSTTLQSALYACRPALLAQGVRHAGPSRNPASAVLAVTGRPSGYIGGAVPPIARWRELVDEVRRAREPRVVVSSEFFADAPAASIPRIVDDLGGDRVHVAVTLRPLVSILPSQWQQYVQDGTRASFEQWLDAMLNGTGRRLTPTFWVRHRHDELVARWASVVGPDRLTVVVLAGSDQALVLRVFERLTGLREGTLVPDPDLSNRSMTLPEIEAIRAFNVAFRASDLPRPLLNRVMHFGAARFMKRVPPEPGAPRIEVPAWALERGTVVAREMLDGIAAQGVRIVGDLEDLVPPPLVAGAGAAAGAGAVTGAGAVAGAGAGAASGVVGASGASGPPVTVSPGVAASMALGVLFASGEARGGRTPAADAGGASPGRRWAGPPGVERIPTRVLTWVVARRVREAAGARWAAVRRRFP